eukprot:10214226-Lingulodinium_polyedra.AAC.1
MASHGHKGSGRLCGVRGVRGVPVRRRAYGASGLRGTRRRKYYLSELCVAEVQGMAQVHNGL